MAPLCNEEDNITELYGRITSTMKKAGCPYEIILVDDGSKDKSREIIKALSSNDPSVKGIFLSRNFGSHIAIQAGLYYASGDIVIQMVGDLQDRPEDIPRLLSRLEEGYDIAYSVNNVRTDPLIKKFFARQYFNVIHMLGLDITIRNAFLAMKRRVVEEVKKLQEPDRYYMGLVDWVGFKKAPVEVDRAARTKGKTKYTFMKSLRLGIYTILQFSDLHFSLLKWSFYLSFLFLLTLAAVIYLMVTGADDGVFTKLLLIMACVAPAVILPFIGILIGYAGRIHQQTANRPLFVIQEIVGNGLADATKPAGATAEATRQ